MGWVCVLFAAGADARCQVAYHTKSIEGMACRYANPPVSVRNDLGSVMDVLRSRIALSGK